MTSKEASEVLGTAVTMNPGASISTFMVLSFPPPTAGPAYWLPTEQHLPSVMTPSFPHGQPVVLPFLPGNHLVAENAGYSPTGHGAGNIIVQVRSEVGQAEPPQTKTLVHTQAPLNLRAPAALCGGAVCPTPQFLAASTVQTVMLAPTAGVSQAVEGGWTPGLPPQAPQQAAQLAPIVPSVSAGPWINGASREGALDTSQSLASLDDTCNPMSVYENFRRWQRFKDLARSHLPQSPDAEALSCFLIPVLRSLSRRKPTMTLEQGMKRAMREWQHTSNFDRMIYYEMAEKFMEFEEEDMQIQKLQYVQSAQGLPPSVPPRPDPSEPPAPMVGSQPVHIPRTAIPSAQSASMQPHRPQLSQKSTAVEEIPPEAVQEYMDIMDELVGIPHSATGEPGGEWKEDRQEPQQEDDGSYLDPGLLSYIDELCSQEDFITKCVERKEDRQEPQQEDDGTYLDPDLLSYIDELCSQEDFFTQVEDVIHPHFLEQMLSSEAQLDPLAFDEELKQEEALTSAQVALKGKVSVQAPMSLDAHRLDSHPPESEACKDARKRDHGPQLGVSDKACPPESDFEVPQRQCGADANLSRPKSSDVSSGRLESPARLAQWSLSPSEGHRLTASGVGPRDVTIPRETSPIRETPRPENGCSEDEEMLPSLSFLLDSQNSLLPWRFPQSPVPASGLVIPGGWGAQRSPQFLSQQKLGLSQADPSAAMSRKRALGGGPTSVEKITCLGADLGLSGGPALPLGSVCSLQPQKRKCDSIDTGKRRKLHCSQ